MPVPIIDSMVVLFIFGRLNWLEEILWYGVRHDNL